MELGTNGVVKAIKNVPGVEGIEFVPELKKVYTSDWYENKIGVVDLKSMSVVKKYRPNSAGRPRSLPQARRLPGSKKLHSLAVDKNTHRVYVPEEQENGHPVSKMIVFEAIGSGVSAAK